MSKCALLSFVASLAVAGPALAASTQVTSGSYACIAQRSVGIQGEAGHHKRVAGRITLPAEKKAFVVQIKKITKIKNGWCQSSKVSSDTMATGYNYWFECGTKYELTFSKGKYPMTFRGSNAHVFRSNVDGLFHVADDLTYVFFYSDLSGNFYLEEGGCKKM